MQNLFKAISISHKKATLQIREQITLNEGETNALYLKLKEVLGINEALIISTCNRTEVYYSAKEDLSTDIIKLLALEKGVDTDQLLNSIEAFNEELGGTKYLFEVSLGLHSQVLGDMQLPNQIKNAYQWSANANMAGPYLHRLMHTIFFANKRIVQETEFRDGAASTSYATVELMEGFLPLLKDPKILVVGLGEIGQDVSQTLADKGYTNITLCNRSKEKTHEVAEKHGFSILNFEELEKEFLQYPIIISSVRVEEPLIKKEHFKNQKGINYLFDLSVPRSIDPLITQVDGVVLYDLDEIQKRTLIALEKRKKAIPKIKEIIDELLVEFGDWTKEMEVSPTIKKLKGALETIRKEEIARHIKNLNSEEAEIVEKITTSIMQKIIKLPVIQLKAACKRGEAETLIDVLNNLFDLEKQEVK